MKTLGRITDLTIPIITVWSMSIHALFKLGFSRRLLASAPLASSCSVVEIELRPPLFLSLPSVTGDYLFLTEGERRMTACVNNERKMKGGALSGKAARLVLAGALAVSLAPSLA